MTCTLQQEASRKLGFTAQLTMSRGAAAVRERLHHLHAYRLDDAVGDRADRGSGQARELYGARLRARRAAQYDRKVKNAQEAHEAIRPAGDCSARRPQLRGELGATSPGSTS